MGADIHVYLEAKNEKGDWEYIYVSDKNNDKITYYHRNYLLFGMLAKVRSISDCPYTKDFRGLPSDVTEEVIKEYNGDCYHSATWYSMAELKLIYEWAKQKYDDDKNTQLLWKLNCTTFEPDVYEDILEMFEEHEYEFYAISNFLDFCEFIFDCNWIFSDEKRVIIWFDN